MFTLFPFLMATTKLGYTALHANAAHGGCNDEIWKYLVTSGKFDLNARDNSGRTPIMLLIAARRLEKWKLQLMLEQEAVDLDLKDSQGLGLEDMARLE